MPRWGLFLVVFCLFLLLRLQGETSTTLLNTNPSKTTTYSAMDALIPTWSKSFQLYQQPHAIWLTEDKIVGENSGQLNAVLYQAKKNGQRAELVIYTIPFRDLGRSSEGGFKTWSDYLADNQLLANRIKLFIQEGGKPPRIYIEPDALAHAIQNRRDHHDDAKSMGIYNDRKTGLKQVALMYKQAGAIVYHDAAHSAWLNYNDGDLEAMASILNEAGIAQVDGLSVNVSNRQPINNTTDHFNEAAYVDRLLPKLKNTNLDVVVDTSRNGGRTYARQYFLAPNGQLIDNESKNGRLMGNWRLDDQQVLWLVPFFGKPMTVESLVRKDDYKYSAQQKMVQAPPYLDPVGDVQLGPTPQNNPLIAKGSKINRFRYIKPPDDCDGSVNCPPGESKHNINQFLETVQPQKLYQQPIHWL